MHFSIAAIALAALSYLPFTSGLNILLNNDDSWASANIREFYKALKAAGHEVLLVAPAINQSGKGGTIVFTDVAKLAGPAEFGSVAAGAPSFGTDPNDSSIWYYDGTPAAVTFFALDYVVPKVWNGAKPDLLVSGPNEGGNLGPFLYTLSGTMGATYAAIERGIPGIAFSAGNSTHRSYTGVNTATDVATLNAKVAVKVVNQLANSVKSGRIFPYGYGLSVNLPLLNSSYSSPKYVQSRLTGGAVAGKAVLNITSGIVTFSNDVSEPGTNPCINGDCSLPGETDVVAAGSVSFSVFTIDYDAPTCTNTTSGIRTLLQPIVLNQNATSANGNNSIATPTISGSAQTKTNAATMALPQIFAILAGIAAMFSLY